MNRYARPSTLALALLLGLAFVAPARATGFWDSLAEPAPHANPEPTVELYVDRATQLFAAARAHAIEWQRTREAGLPRAAREQLAEMKHAAELAIKELERALALRPDDASLHYWIAGALYEFVYFYYEEQALPSKRDEAGRLAIAHWAEFERISPKDPRRTNFVRPQGYGPLGPTPHAGPTSWARSPYQFKRSLIYTKLGGDDNFAHALEDYDFILRYTPRDAYAGSDLSVSLTNSAEILMAAGRLEESIERYREGVGTSGGEVLYMYGLAVALDRAGFTESGLDMMSDALAREATPFEQLNRSGVFFVPSGDVHYYYGLGHEALGHCDAAIEQYETFLRLRSTKRYHKAARDHIAFLTKAKRDRKRCPPQPSHIRIPGWSP